ncbi:RagB/SusD family nutrient uptake outer membrane protein [Mucilaginibacter sp. SG564]|uniref:RagB/SusD family nutrient uptake outer membrane protein n=1 Tax=Mucilaginibacter sp. SG564 TaxID=2587022 RepID=UPI0015533CC8|nr:RagB/SusD family nutrient uptake outer membrane protein [Mucilaginibacter sp. SG564]NOW95986.1 hypothetical protein [Mucilaginibacter sp. SG564]
MKTNTIIISVAFLGFAIYLSSCKKFVEISPPKNQLTSDKVFADSTDANSAISGIYIDMIQSTSFSISSGGLTLYPGLSADELSQSAKDADINALYINHINIENRYNAVLWATAYKYIYDANTCIEGIYKSTGISQSAKNLLTAEARQIRAFMYFNLVNLYGPVPLVKTTDYHVNDLLPRSQTDSIYAQILADATFAQSFLPKNNKSERANYYAATALLAKVQLYRKNYNAAETEASKVINSGVFKLENDLNNVFLAGSSEAIWKIIPVYPNVETPEGFNFVPSSKTVSPKYILSNDLINSFETGDTRKSKWTAINVVAGISYPYPFKYKEARTTGDPSETYIIFRLADQYLIRAEARAAQNNMTGAQADLNVIRNRAGLPNTAASDLATLLTAIERERRSEFFCEWGNRWFDLNRWHLSDVILPSTKPNWLPSSALYPIPQKEILRNPALIQNPGY